MPFMNVAKQKSLKHILLLSALATPLLLSTMPSYAAKTVQPLCIGVQCKQQAKTAEAFIPVLATQIKRYNQIAPTLWPNNHVINLTAIVVNKNRTQAWKIKPTGEHQKISVAKADTYGKTSGYDTEFLFFKHKMGEQGVVMTLNDDALKDPNTYKNYPHLGTYDVFITYVHEAFHHFEQPQWKTIQQNSNKERNEFFDQVAARATRAVIYQELLNAFINPKQLRKHAKQAAATYLYYKKTYPIDYKHALPYDNLEGSAFYLELVSSLYVSYPQLKTKDDIFKAYGVIAPTIDVVKKAGLVNEAYNLGGAAGMLLDQFAKDPSVWKKNIMHNPNATALNQLADLFKAELSPKDIIKPTKQMIQALTEIAKQNAQGSELDAESLSAIKTILLDMKKTSPAAYEAMHKDLQTTNPKAYEQLKNDLK